MRKRYSLVIKGITIILEKITDLIIIHKNFILSKYFNDKLDIAVL